jgi:hypothetical protein
MADTVASPASRSSRSATAKRRGGVEATGTEDKLARAAKSAEHLARLSNASREEKSADDLFRGDPVRAALQVRDIDTRQGTLEGFEWPGEALAGAARADKSAGDVMATAASVSSSSSSSTSPELDELSGNVSGARGLASPSVPQAQVQPTATPTPIPASSAGKTVNVLLESQSAAEFDAALAPASEAVASAIRSVATARRQSESRARASENTASGHSLASELGAAVAGGRAARDASHGRERLSEAVSARAGEEGSGFAQPNTAPAQSNAFAREAAPCAAASRQAPDLDWARAKAFADTVDALYGVIADQRRAAGGQSRRMKWLLSIVVAALLVTLVTGITQTAWLMRLVHENTARQARIDDLLLGQQAVLTMLAAQAAAAHSVADNPVAPSARQTPQTATANHPKPPPRRHKLKPAVTHSEHGA